MGVRWTNEVEEMRETCKALRRADFFSGMPRLFLPGFLVR